MAVIIRLTLIQNNKAACFNTKIHYEEIHGTFEDQNNLIQVFGENDKESKCYISKLNKDKPV